jgi:hypothetical protein
MFLAVREANFRYEDGRQMNVSLMGATSAIWQQGFREAFCTRYNCSAHEFERAVFWRCLYRHALPFAIVMMWFNPDFFAEDFAFVREIGATTSDELFKAELNFFHGRNVRERNWFRRGLTIRVSAKRLLRLKNRLIRES